MSETPELDSTAQAVGQIMSITEESFNSLIAVLDSTQLPTSQARLEAVVVDALPSKDDVERFTAFALAYASTLYWGSFNADRTLKRMSVVTAEQLGLESGAVEDRLRALFRSRAVLLLAGAQAGRRQTVGLLERATIQMDLRPVVHPDGGKVEMFGVYHRLHLVVTDDDAGDAEKTVEVVLDHADLKQLEALAAASLRAQQDIQASLAESGGTVYLPLRKES